MENEQESSCLYELSKLACYVAGIIFVIWAVNRGLDSLSSIAESLKIIAGKG